MGKIVLTLTYKTVVSLLHQTTLKTSHHEHNRNNSIQII